MKLSMDTFDVRERSVKVSMDTFDGRERTVKVSMDTLSVRCGRQKYPWILLIVLKSYLLDGFYGNVAVFS